MKLPGERVVLYGVLICILIVQVMILSELKHTGEDILNLEVFISNQIDILTTKVNMMK